MINSHTLHTLFLNSTARLTAMYQEITVLPNPLLLLLRNQLILRLISPYLSISDLLALGATSTPLRSLIYNTPYAFSRIDLTKCRHAHVVLGHGSIATWSTLNTDGYHDYCAQPLQRVLGAMQKCNILLDVSTLILDGLAVPANILRDLLCNESYNIRILSLREVIELGDDELIQTLRYITRPTRPKGTPKLKGLYYFTPLSAPIDWSATGFRRFRASQHQHQHHRGITDTVGAQLGGGTGVSHTETVRLSWHQIDPWYSATGSVLKPSVLKPEFEDDWANLLQACKGLIAFDAVLCRHPSRPDSSRDFKKPKLATVSLEGCVSCGSCPEGPAFPGQSSEDQLPLLAPPPLYSSRVSSAQALDTEGLPHPGFIARCRTCLMDRWCERCNIWWCESCYVPNGEGPLPLLKLPTIPTKIKDPDNKIKVHNSLCVFKCLVESLMNDMGEGGMWG